jgi:hypothetical protein
VRSMSFLYAATTGSGARTGVSGCSGLGVMDSLYHRHSGRAVVVSALGAHSKP